MDIHVLLGITSRGTGPIGNCGGRGNPTHYVRVRDMVQWMTLYIEDLCIIEGEHLDTTKTMSEKLPVPPAFIVK